MLKGQIFERWMTKLKPKAKSGVETKMPRIKFDRSIKGIDENNKERSVRNNDSFYVWLNKNLMVNKNLIEHSPFNERCWKKLICWIYHYCVTLLIWGVTDFSGEMYKYRYPGLFTVMLLFPANSSMQVAAFIRFLAAFNPFSF